MTFKIAARSTRAGEIVSAPAEDSREVEISFSSEAPILRAFWDEDAGEIRHYHEVLGHAPGEVDLSRLNTGAAPLLKDHEARIDSQIGVVVRAWTAEGRGRAVVRFSTNAAADDVLARVRVGDVTCVSVGYGITQAEKDGMAEDGRPIVRAVNWTPREISFVAIPADPSVGYGRADQSDVETLSITESKDMTKPNNTPAPVTDEQRAAPAPAPAAPATPAADPAAEIARALTDERTRTAEIEAIGERFDMPAEAVRKAKDNGTTADQFRKLVMDTIDNSEAEATRAGAAKIGMTDNEIRAFSLLNVVRYLDNPTDRNRERAAFEIEASRAAAQAAGKDPEGLFVPADVMMDANFARAATTPATAGGHLVATDHLSGSFIGLLRNRLALAGLGVRMLSGLQGNVDIPKQTGGSTTYWVGEGDDGTDSDITVGVVSMSPHTMAIAVPITRRLLKQADPSAEALVRMDLIEQAALSVDQAALTGFASPDSPEALRAKLIAAGGDRVVTWADTTGNLPDFKEMVQLETNVNAANADESAMSYIYGAKMSGHLKTTQEFASEGRPIERGREVNGYSRTRSNQVADAEAFFGAWNNLVIGMWGGLDMRTDRSTLAKSDGVVLRAFQDLDVAVRNLEGFTLGKAA
ncbi:phage major capsid protein [Roseobacter sp. YSTF-M11]|uniref:Phage major capsid protein n=1 Tax=Roseobacter insulae TaxID=2859783 RepID=A0A9X1FXQ6_9RHOB|nr:phage major capsid protein [Roseobacter insulae]MBW4709578.1 phage major capsid protein [Roseobacter insulae]